MKNILHKVLKYGFKNFNYYLAFYKQFDNEYLIQRITKLTN